VVRIIETARRVIDMGAEEKAPPAQPGPPGEAGAEPMNCRAIHALISNRILTDSGSLI